MNGTRVLEALRDNLKRVSPRADGNYNASDFMWALDEAIREVDMFEDDERMGEDQ